MKKERSYRFYDTYDTFERSSPHWTSILIVTNVIIITMQRASPIAQQSEKGTQSSRIVWCSHASSMKSTRSFGTLPVLSVHPRNKIWIDLFMTDGMMLSLLNYKSEFQIQPRRSRTARQAEIFTVLRSRPAENLHMRVPFTGIYKWYHRILESGNILTMDNLLSSSFPG
jgi:hypothetical protein